MIDEFQFKCKICGKVISANLKNYKTMAWAIYSHVKSHKLFELFPVPYPFVMNKDLVTNFISIKAIQQKPVSLIENNHKHTHRQLTE
jgi:hypothetical protein